MNFRNNFLMAAIMLLAVTSCQAQKTNEKPVDSTATSINGAWYTYNANFQIRESVIKDTLWINTTSDPNFESDTPEIDTTYIRKLSDDYYLMTRPGWKRKRVAKLELAENNSVLKISPVTQGEDEKVLLETYKTEPVKAWAELQTMNLLNNDRFEQLKNAPGMDEMTRDDVIKSLAARKEISPMLLEYYKANPKRGKFSLYRMVNDYRNEVMIKMGYNPYKMLKGDPFKKFENDAEVMKLLNEPMSWEK
ncbi:hypothetical protein [Spongiivirga citrea]|uniref:Uncharacterized protein n=1 Tax=Spongiivirga citrea TaxID=1481457 RepID=A0A6M0CM83_9FLAO|nr:hypothetical protein [Spongiivirga citrea]NER19058.1 hypothetical protein [Spongiivirga citrea]